MYHASHQKLLKIKARKYAWGDNSTAVFSKYSSKLLGALISKGNRPKAYKKYANLQHELKMQTGIESYKILYIALLKISPTLQVKFKKVSGKLQPVPSGLMSENKRVTYSIKWAIKLLRDKNKTRNISMKQLATLLIQAMANTGEIIAHKRKWQQVALANRYSISDMISRVPKGS